MAAHGKPLGDPPPGNHLHGEFGGRTEWLTDEQGRLRVRWMPDKVVKGVAYDTPIAGYRVRA